MKDFLPLEVREMGEISGNVYKSVMIASKRANQLTIATKEELARKLAEFAPAYDNLEEVMENKEQIEISRFFERKPKSTQVATEAMFAGEIYFRDPHDESL